MDCDVEAPNAHIFLKPLFEDTRDVNIMIPVVDEGRCSGCGRCGEVCEFHAIVVLGGKPLVFPNLCHGCGSCTLECPDEAITEIPQKLGLLEQGPGFNGIHTARGTLNVGEPMAVPVISQLKKWSHNGGSQITIIDSPPGTSCPVVESIRGAQFVILVTEPTPFGLHDLKLAVELVSDLNIPAGVIVNRDGIGDESVEEFCIHSNLPILLRIPMEREIGEGIAQGKILTEIRPDLVPVFQQLYKDIEKTISKQEACL
jgi:MinD superfamily P-loop ATPase